MIGVRFVVMTLLVFIAGAWSRAFRDVRALPVSAQLAVAFATGLVTLAVEMMVWSAVGGRWSWWALMILPAIGVLVPSRAQRAGTAGSAGWPSLLQERRKSVRFLPRKLAGIPRFRGFLARLGMTPATVVAIVALLVFASAVLSADATSGDFVFFWGTKGQHFGQARMFDVAFLRNPDHVVMHPEYPPLVPLYYAWTMLGAVELDWFGAMASAILFLALGTAAVSGLARDARFGALFASTFALLCMRNSVAGNAEPALLFFEAVALGALVARNDAVAAIALCGIALTKIEGAVFVVIAIALLGRRWKVALPPLLTLGAWLLFAKVNGLLGASDPRYAMSTAYLLPSLRQLLHEMSFGLWYAPWIALVAVLAAGRARAALPHILAALAFLAFMVAIYAHPEAHMEWSAQRVLMTPLLVFFFGAVAAQRWCITRSA